MNILTHIHAYPPKHNAGAEWYMHAALKWLVARGHICNVLTETSEIYTIDGVTVIPDSAPYRAEYYPICDVVITHLGRAGKAWNCSQTWRKPIIHVCHNDFTNRLTEVKADFQMVYNSDWMEASMTQKGSRKGFTLHPVIWFDDYNTPTTREYITLINCNENKGGRILVQLAEEMSDRKFLGVIGHYGDQVKAVLPNLTYVPHTSTIRDIYAKSRIVLMPSTYESYGRVAVEAMCSGIPVLCNTTPGLMEALGDCGTYSGWNVDNYIEDILSLDDEKAYNDLSLRMIKRAKMLDARNVEELEAFEVWIKQIRNNYNPYYNR